MPEQNMIITKSIDSGENGSSVFNPGHIIAYLGQITQTVSGGVATTTAPNGWLLCNGNIISKTEYANLWNAVKHLDNSYPYGSTSTTFTLPNLSNRFLSIGVFPTSHQGGSSTHSHGGVSMTGWSNEVGTVHNHNQANHSSYADVYHGHGDGGGYIGPNGSGSTADANKTGSGGSGVGPGAGHIHDATANVGPVPNNMGHSHAINVGQFPGGVTHTHNIVNANSNTGNQSSSLIPTLRVNFIIKV
jgi:microcystin-dependent protein